MYLFSYYSCATGPAAPLFVTFKRPVRNVTVQVVGVNANTKVATARFVHTNGSVDTRDVVGRGNYTLPVLLDGVGIEDVSKLEVVDVADAFGLGFDDLTFDILSP